MAHLLIFGLGYTAQRIKAEMEARGWRVDATGRAGNLDFDDDFDRVRAIIDHCTHVLSSVPPENVTGGDDVLMTYGGTLRAARERGKWIGYLSSTGVYGDRAGAWVDEATPTIAQSGEGRRNARAEADLAWLEMGARVFRLPGIYGPGRSALDRVREGKARRIDLPDQVFSRVHVDDIMCAVVAALTQDAPPGAYNIGDDLPASGNEVTEHACRLLGVEPPPLETLEEANLSEMARGFYMENRRVANGKAKRVLGWSPRYST
ncbi:MAG TPA: SDR family NAD(P)-dependent oxidoreductase, partial [Erythrobacter sp.]|nr:SDR family NAD(P)-dependent oxidoreductase [Erythrobacter sp.]